jgi:predicted RNase H-like HicB family nuclease
MIHIDFDVVVFQEGKTYVAYSPKLDLSSCGDTVDTARKNLKTAVQLFLEEAANMGTLEEILKEAGYEQESANSWLAPRIVATELMHLEA